MNDRMAILTVGSVDSLLSKPFRRVIFRVCSMSGWSASTLARVLAVAVCALNAANNLIYDRWMPGLAFWLASNMAWTFWLLLRLIPRWEKIGDDLREMIPSAVKDLFAHVRFMRLLRFAAVAMLLLSIVSIPLSRTAQAAWSVPSLLLAAACYYSLTTLCPARPRRARAKAPTLVPATVGS